MRDDLECPYCGEGLEVCHDDGQGYDQDRLHEMSCSNCDKNFVFTTSISYYYEPYKADCLNGSPHNYKATMTYPREFTKMRCTMCEDERRPTDEEMKAIMAK